MKKHYFSAILLLIGVGVRANTFPVTDNSPGPKIGLNASYTPNEMRIMPQDAEQQWTFSLAIKAVNGHKPVPEPLVTRQKNAVQFDHDHHFKVEYTNDEQSIRQRFIIREPGEADGKLTVQLQPENSWQAMYGSANSLTFKNKDQILNYSDLEVQDATGKKLPAHFTVQQNQVEIAVDAGQAAYPVSVQTIVGPLTERHARTVLERNQAGIQFGTATTTAGDINGDGFIDVLVGAPYYSNGQTAEGAVFVYYGAANGIAPNAVFTVLERNVANGHFGEVIAGGGDVNGDGYDDVVVGAPYKAGMPGSDTGYVYVYYGSAAGINPTPYIIRSARQGDNFGVSVFVAKLNYDKPADIVIGANNGAGYVTIYYGSVWGINNSLIIEVTASGTTGFGTKVLISGNLDGMSGNYLLATAGEDLHVFNHTGQEIDPSYHEIIHSPVPGISFGSSIAAQHDIDGDGYNDIIVGAKDYTNGSLNHAGAVYVFRGGNDATGTVPNFLTPWRTIKGDKDSALLGAQVAFAGDVNNDGHADVIVSSPGWESIPAQPNLGKVWLYYGKSSGLDSLAGATIQSTQANSWLGSSVAGAGDVDNDGYDDIIVGAPLYDKGQVDEGVALIYLGGAYSLARMANTKPDDVVETKTPAVVKTFPNPVLNNLSVQFEGLDVGADTYIQISDVMGSVVKTVRLGKVDSGNQAIDVSTLAPGTYFMIINNGSKVIREKIIKQ
ncbi:FG-GAP-like repeat-containing protein [Chitinophaga ginsengisoli]|uniref:Putative secreted protein (Por secretion system target) n=1 Tax=Chitinophaga ginsengisoli TaxID=363837 RepID=A0A2P8G5D3_9BACT|nr:FG-GAP-like repeat-containing protein [Chitinophaga ginsengisoli]PSL29105.1 putative secreted protein (Por secretion system target) [Chitinophaga ginsengisoli]